MIEEIIVAIKTLREHVGIHAPLYIGRSLALISQCGIPSLDI